MKRKLSQVKLRLPKSLHNQLTQAADDSFRSMNAEINHRLDQSFNLELLKAIHRQNEEMIAFFRMRA